jgi:hypothetical protein
VDQKPVRFAGTDSNGFGAFCRVVAGSVKQVREFKSGFVAMAAVLIWVECGSVVSAELVRFIT